MQIAVIADIIDSRSLDNRTIYQKKITAFLAELSSQKRPDLLSPYTVTLGDEFQAVFSRPDRLLTDALAILLAFPQRPIRFCFGLGGISTEINPHMALGMDGPAFNSARDLMDQFKKEKGTVIGFAGSSRLGLINTSLRIWSEEWAKWSVNTKKAFGALVRGEAAEKAALDAGVSVRAVYKAISVHGLKNYEELFRNIIDEIRKLTKEEK
jgi:predicted nucleotidyltransferase